MVPKFFFFLTESFLLSYSVSNGEGIQQYWLNNCCEGERGAVLERNKPTPRGRFAKLLMSRLNDDLFSLWNNFAKLKNIFGALPISWQ